VPDRKPVFGWKIAHIQGARKFETGVYSCTWGPIYNLANFCSNAV